jgi:hypothetical protein
LFYLILLRELYKNNKIKKRKIQLYILRNFIEKGIYTIYHIILRKILYNLIIFRNQLSNFIL